MDRPAIFITGAAAGIGRATAELFSSRGWFVGAFDLNAAELESLRAKLGAQNCLAETLDVTDATALSSALKHFFQTAGNRLDLLFNCAGIASVAHFEDIPLARHHQIVDVNLKGVLNGLHCALPYLKQTRGARVISMCSASAIYGAPAFASYCATKFAVRGLTEALNIEWARHGIKVMDLLPLFVATPMVAGMKDAPVSLSRLGVRLQAQDIAAVVWRAAHWRFWPRAHWYPGWQSALMALLQKLSPTWLNRLSTKMVSGY